MADRQPRTSTPPDQFAINAGSVVNIQRVGESARVQAEVLGAVPGAYIVLRDANTGQENRNLRYLALRSEDPLILRFMHEGVVYGFRTAVSRLVTDPEYLVFVLYPRLVEHVSVRREPRALCRMPCLVTYAGGDAQPALMLDVSAAGCRVVSPFDEDETASSELPTVTVTLVLPGQAEPFHVSGSVRRLTCREEGRVLGIAFDQEQRSLYDALDGYFRFAPQP